jgi:hypothetical protein
MEISINPEDSFSVFKLLNDLNRSILLEISSTLGSKGMFNSFIEDNYY